MFFRLCVIFGVLIVTGCAGTEANIIKPYRSSNNDYFVVEVRNEAGATDAGLKVFNKQLNQYNGALNVGSESPNRKAIIVFTNYYVRDGATRALLGIMAGSDNIITVTTVKELSTGDILGLVEHETSNPTAVIGINSLIKEHANKVGKYLLAR